jgi:hypothetical protein
MEHAQGSPRPWASYSAKDILLSIPPQNKSFMSSNLLRVYNLIPSAHVSGFHDARYSTIVETSLPGFRATGVMQLKSIFLLALTGCSRIVVACLTTQEQCVTEFGTRSIAQVPSQTSAVIVPLTVYTSITSTPVNPNLQAAYRD